VDRERSKDAGLALALILLLVAWIAAGIRHPLIAAAAAIVLICMTAPRIFAPFAALWFGLSRVLGAVVSRVVLTAVYALVVFPMGLALRLAGADAMQMKRWKKADGSVFVDRNHRFTKEDVEHPY